MYPDRMSPALKHSKQKAAAYSAAAAAWLFLFLLFRFADVFTVKRTFK